MPYHHASGTRNFFLQYLLEVSASPQLHLLYLFSRSSIGRYLVASPSRLPRSLRVHDVVSTSHIVSKASTVHSHFFLHRIGVWAHPANEVECPFHPLHELRYGMLRRVVTAIAPWRTLMDSNAAALERRPRRHSYALMSAIATLCSQSISHSLIQSHVQGQGRSKQDNPVCIVCIACIVCIPPSAGPRSR